MRPEEEVTVHTAGQEEELPVLRLLPVAEGQEVLLRSGRVTL